LNEVRFIRRTWPTQYDIRSVLNRNRQTFNAGRSIA